MDCTQLSAETPCFLMAAGIALGRSTGDVLAVAGVSGVAAAAGGESAVGDVDAVAEEEEPLAAVGSGPKDSASMA